MDTSPVAGSFRVDEVDGDVGGGRIRVGAGDRKGQVVGILGFVIVCDAGLGEDLEVLGVFPVVWWSNEELPVPVTCQM